MPAKPAFWLREISRYLDKTPKTQGENANSLSTEWRQELNPNPEGARHMWKPLRFLRLGLIHTIILKALFENMFFHCFLLNIFLNGSSLVLKEI